MIKCNEQAEIKFLPTSENEYHSGDKGCYIKYVLGPTDLLIVAKYSIISDGL